MITTTGSTAEDVVGYCADLLEKDGLHAVLAHLNSRTLHRCTGVYVFEPPLLINIALFDRENPGIVRGGNTPMADTYCSIIDEDDDEYSTPDADTEPRLATHPARARVLAYSGVPLRDSAGKCFGTICHFDDRPRLVPKQEIPVLYALTGMLAANVLQILDAESALETGGSVAVPDRIQVGAHNEADQFHRGRRRKETH